MKGKITVLLLTAMLILTGCAGGKMAPENEGILGTWYESSSEEMYIVVFYDEGTYMRTLEEFAGDYNHGINLKRVTVPGSVKEIFDRDWYGNYGNRRGAGWYENLCSQ